MTLRADKMARRAWERAMPTSQYIPPSSDANSKAAKYTSATRQLVVDWAFSRRNFMRLSSETGEWARRCPLFRLWQTRAPCGARAMRMQALGTE